MTISSTEVVKKLFECAFAGDFEGLKRYLHPDVRVNEAAKMTESRMTCGARSTR